MSAVIVSGIGTAFSVDPSISLKNYLKDNYAGSFKISVNSFKEGAGSFKSTTPKVATIKYDTKWARLDGSYFVTIKNNPMNMQWLGVGGQRKRLFDEKRIEVMAKQVPGRNRYTDAWLMADRIDDMINGNKGGIATSGIKKMWITEIDEVRTVDDAQITKAVADSNQIALFRLKCVLQYDKVVASASAIVPTNTTAASRKVALLNAPFSESPQQSLIDKLVADWTATTSITSSNAGRDFSSLTGANRIVVEWMPLIITPAKTGGDRDNYMAQFRVQVYCQGHSSLDNRWKMQEEIQRILAPPRAMASDGFYKVKCSRFVPIETHTYAQLKKSEAESSLAARSHALVQLWYSKISS